jgi:sugar/nucleoside kinase (ribokinase family)
MGDTLNIDELFSHDLVIVATRDVALRRFLADLPVHTHPGVRMLSLIHFRDGVLETERIEDLTRFDVLVGAEVDYRILSPAGSEAPADNALAAFAPLIQGTNVRAAISWGKHGAFRCVTREEPVFTLPPHHAPPTTSDAPWAAFVGAVAVGLVRRQGWPEIGREASRRFAIRAQSLRSEST